MAETQTTKAGAHVIHYTVNDEPQETTEHQLTASQILTNAGIDPSQNYLIQLEGRHQTSYKDNPETVIHMHEKQTFISNFTGPVPVS